MGTSPRFTDRDIKLIAAALPKDTDPKRLRRLALILREWAQVELKQYLKGGTPQTVRERRERFQRAADAYGALDDIDLYVLAKSLFRLAGIGEPEAGSSESCNFDLVMAVLDNLAKAMRTAPNPPKRGRKPNRVEYLVARDILAIAHWLIGRRPSRRVNRTGGDETGPFYDFAGAIWPIVFGRGDAGLDWAMRQAVRYWNAEPSRRERSPIIANINLRLCRDMEENARAIE